MTNTITTNLIAILLLVLHAAPQAQAQQQKSEAAIADFEGKKSVSRNTTHKAIVTVVDDAPEGGGKLASKTVVEKAAGAKGHFGTGFVIPVLDLSGAKEIRFWIKTDMESTFNFQIHSDGNRASVFRFSTVDSKVGTWKQITAPLARFNQPPWSKGKADLTKINKFQVTAFGSGPYDGKYIILDQVVSSETRSRETSAKPPRAKDPKPVQRGRSKQAQASWKPKPPPEGVRSLPDYDKDVRPILASHCFKCHGPEKQKSDVRFDTLATDLIKDRAAAETWHEALSSLNLGEMPPDDEPQLGATDRGILTSWIRHKIELAIKARKSTDGEVILRRLNRTEYQNTMVDLLGVEADYSENLPPETPSEEGFLNNGSSLSISPMAFEYYLGAARLGLSKAIVTGSAPKVITAKITETESPRLFNINKERDAFTDTLSVGGKYVAQMDEFPDAGEFLIRVTARAKLLRGVTFARLKALFGFRATVEYPSRELGVVDVTSEQSTVFEFRGRMENFPRPSRDKNQNPFQLIILTNAFDDGKERESTRQVQVEVEGKDSEGKITRRKVKKNEVVYHEDVPTITIESVEFTGPLYESWPPQHHQQILFPSPMRDQNESAYAREVVAKFMRRAYRRPVQDEEVESIFRFFGKVRPNSASLEEAMRETLALVLVSPDFLYLVEPEDGDGESKTPLTDFELASRLSYFLWSTMPDARLLELAESGTLREPSVLAAEIDRMLADERSWQFVKQFTDQWLDLGAVDRVAVNPQYYENWDNSLEPWMQEETIRFFAEILRNDLSALNFLDSDFAMLNAPMARHYGIEHGPRGSNYERVNLPSDSRRGGLLGQASMLLGNSTGEDSHPILRAVWIRERLLDDPPAPPPPNVPALDSENPDFDQLPVREQLEIHRKDAACADCHRSIDPWGIALEQFDAVGNWRGSIKRFDGNKELSLPVSTETTLPGGHKIAGADDLKTFLVKHRSEQFANAIASRMTSYALGRSIEFVDDANVEEIADQFVESDYKLRSLIHAIVSSELFQTK